VTNYKNFSIERSLSVDALSPAQSETFLTEDMHSAHDTQKQGKLQKIFVINNCLHTEKNFLYN
jgi:hypothetical protein